MPSFRARSKYRKASFVSAESAQTGRQRGVGGSKLVASLFPLSIFDECSSALLLLYCWLVLSAFRVQLSDEIVDLCPFRGVIAQSFDPR